MKFKLRVFKKDFVGRVYVGKEGFNIPKNALVEVIASPHNTGDIIMRTGSSQNPFFNKKTKEKWGTDIESYTFKIISKDHRFE